MRVIAVSPEWRSSQPPRGARRDCRDGIEFSSRRGNRDIEHLGNHLCPSVDEVRPTILDLDRRRGGLRARLIEKREGRPGSSGPTRWHLGKPGGVPSVRAGGVLAEASCIDHERSGREACDDGVVLLGMSGEHAFNGNAMAEAMVDRAHMFEAPGAPVRDDDARGAVPSARKL